MGDHRRKGLGPVAAVVLVIAAGGCTSAVSPEKPSPAVEEPVQPPGKPFGMVLDRAVSLVAGTGKADSTGDGGPALEASLELPGSLTFDTRGNLYIAERLRIRKVAPDGTITTFAGDGSNTEFSEGEPSGPPGDGGPAIHAQMEIPEDLAFAPDGSLYFVEPLAGRIRRVASDGTIDTVVGNGRVTCGISPSSHQGKDPESISVCSLRGLTFLANGDLVFADGQRLWRLHGDRIYLFAGNGRVVLDPSRAGDGGPATKAGLTAIADLAADRNGSIYIAEDLDGRVRKVSPRGRISTFIEDLGGASDLLFDDSGHLFVASSAGGLIRVARDGSATPLLPGFLDSVASRDRLASLLFGPPGSDLAMDKRGSLYVSMNIEGFQNVLRIRGPWG
ncbi:MAG: hypothetical protein ACRDGU_08165 [Actinomycetota bacterium]